MAILTYNCPHQQCLVQHVGLIIVGTTHVQTRDWAAHLVCPKCKMPSAAIVRSTGDSNDFRAASSSAGDVLDMGWSVVDFWPPAPKPLIPEFLHPDIERVYLQAERNFPIAGNEEAAGTMYGKALDVALKKLDPTLKGMLVDRIKALAHQGTLTANLEDWATRVRWLRNEAAHDEAPISRPDLDDLRNFTEMLMRYLFTLPNMVKKRRGEKLPWETDPPA